MRSAWNSELLKIISVRRQWTSLALAVAVIPLTSLLVAAGGGLGTSNTITSGAATGSVFGLLAFGSWAAAIAAGEYSLQTIVVSLASVPRRTTLYGAKLAAATAAAAAGSVVSVSAAFAVVWAVTPHGTHRSGNPAALLSVLLAVVAVTAIGVAAGILTRSPAASMAAVFAVVLIPQAAGGLLGGLQPWVVGASPGVVIAQVVGNSQLATDQTFPAGTLAAVATLLVVAGAVAAGGARALLRRDG